MVKKRINYTQKKTQRGGGISDLWDWVKQKTGSVKNYLSDKPAEETTVSTTNPMQNKEDITSSTYDDTNSVHSNTSGSTNMQTGGRKKTKTKKTKKTKTKKTKKSKKSKTMKKFFSFLDFTKYK